MSSYHYHGVELPYSEVYIQLTDFLTSSPAQMTYSVSDPFDCATLGLEKCHVRASAVCFLGLWNTLWTSRMFSAKDPCTCFVEVCDRYEASIVVDALSYETEYG
jgi:hypothetical protein